MYNFEFGFIIRNLPTFMSGLQVTVELSLATMLIAIPGGLVLAAGKIWGRPLIRIAVTGFIDFWRNTPLLNQLFLIFFAFPAFGVKFPAFLSAVLALGILHSTTLAEVYRASIESVSNKQGEAGRALAMRNRQVQQYVILPQAAVLSIPPVVNELVLLIKNTSLAATVGVLELTLRGRILAERTAASFESFVAIAILYLGLTSMLGLIAQYSERRFRIH